MPAERDEVHRGMGPGDEDCISLWASDWLVVENGGVHGVHSDEQRLNYEMHV